MDQNDTHPSNRAGRQQSPSSRNTRSRPMFDTSRLLKELNSINSQISKRNENTTRTNNVENSEQNLKSPPKRDPSDYHDTNKPSGRSNRYDINETKTSHYVPNINHNRMAQPPTNRNVKYEENVMPPRRETSKYSDNNRSNDTSNRYDEPKKRDNHYQPRSNDRTSQPPNRVSDRNVKYEENVTPPRRETSHYHDNNRSNRYDEPMERDNHYQRSDDRMARPPRRETSNYSDNYRSNDTSSRYDEPQKRDNHYQRQSHDTNVTRRDTSHHYDNNRSHNVSNQNDKAKERDNYYHPQSNERMTRPLDRYSDRNITGRTHRDISPNSNHFTSSQGSTNYQNEVMPNDLRSKLRRLQENQDSHSNEPSLGGYSAEVIKKPDVGTETDKKFEIAISPRKEVTKVTPLKQPDSIINKGKIDNESKPKNDNNDFAPIFGVLKFKKKFVESVNSGTSSTTSKDKILDENVCTKGQNGDKPLHTGQVASKISSPSDQNNSDDPLIQFKSLLNQLTRNNFETLIVKINQLKINDNINECVKHLYEMAISQQKSSIVFAQLTARLTLIKAERFRTTLLQKCRDGFERHVNSMDDWSETVDEEGSFGNVRFIGELLKVNMITEDEVFHCIDRLLLKSQDEVSIKCIWILLTTAGKFLECSESKSKLDECFSKLDGLIARRSTNTIRAIVMDLIDLRKASWNRNS